MSLAIRGLMAVGLLSIATLAISDARVQIVHAAPFSEALEGTSVTVTANGNTVLEDFLFGDFTGYLELAAGDYDLAVIPTGTSDPAIEASVTLESGTDYTVLAIGDGVNQDLALWPLVDQATDPGADNLNIRIVHAAPFAADLAETEVSVRTAGGVVVNDLVGVPYFAESGFFALPAGTYDVKVASNDGRTNFIDPLPVDLPAGIDLTVIAIGDGVNQPLGLLALPVGQLETRAPVDNSVNGWWASALGGSEGFILQPIPAENRLVGTAYTWDLAGSGESRWFTFDSCSSDIGAEQCETPGAFDGRETIAALYGYSGGSVAGSEPADGDIVGLVSFDFIDCNSAIAVVELGDGTSVSWDLYRLTDTLPCTID